MLKTKEQLNELPGVVVDTAIEVHREFDPGLLERVYEAALKKELSNRGISSERQVSALVVYKGEVLDEEAYKIDLMAEDTLVVELKTVPSLLPIHEAQLLTYLRLTRKNNIRLLINFNTILLRDGIKRRVFNFPT